MTIRVVVADDHAIVREGLNRMLGQEDDIEVVALVDDGLQAVDAAREKAPHVVLMDLSMRGMNGIEATRRIAGETPETLVLCLSMHAERRFVLEVLQAGASGYVLKDASFEELSDAIRALARGEKYVSPAITGIVLEGLLSGVSDAASASLAALTAREREVLQLLAEGHSTKEIALRLQVSGKTVATHREHLMRKLGLDSIAGLTKYAIRHGVTTTDRHRPA